MGLNTNSRPLRQMSLLFATRGRIFCKQDSETYNFVPNSRPLKTYTVKSNNPLSRGVLSPLCQMNARYLDSPPPLRNFWITFLFSFLFCTRCSLPSVFHPLSLKQTSPQALQENSVWMCKAFHHFRLIESATHRRLLMLNGISHLVLAREEETRLLHSFSFLITCTFENQSFSFREHKGVCSHILNCFKY